MARKLDLLGKTFNYLTVIKHSHSTRQGSYWECQCVCGNLVIKRGNRIVNTKCSCGCMTPKVSSDAHKIHGRTNTPEWHSWRSMHQRCYQKTHAAYKKYGGRGIGICSAWRNCFAKFFVDMGTRPEGMTLDRIDRDGNYSPNNCRWATAKTQNRNHSRVKLSAENVEKIRALLVAGSGGNQEEIALRFGVSKATITLVKQGKVWGNDDA